jgi:non-heme chloroperoxidase
LDTDGGIAAMKDLKSVEMSVLVLHGEDDQIVPYATTALKAAELLKNEN